MGVDELVEQAGLPHARLPDDGSDLSMTRPGPLERLLQGRELLLAPYEAGEPPHGAGLQTSADRTGPDQLNDLDWLCQPAP
jgi:hypothetical protein